MKELVEKWRGRVSEWKSHPMFGAQENIQAAGLQASAYEVEQCIKELESTLSPRPIEEAPRDGTPILLFGRHWNEPAQRWDTGWIEGKWFDDEAHRTQNHFTHWVPLPENPPLPSMDGGEK